MNREKEKRKRVFPEALSFRLTIAAFSDTAKELLDGIDPMEVVEEKTDAGNRIMRIVEMVPAYWLACHATELYLKYPHLLYRTEQITKKHYVRHNLRELYELVSDMGGYEISGAAEATLLLLSRQHRMMLLRYDVLDFSVDEGGQISTNLKFPRGEDVIQMLDELERETEYIEKIMSSEEE